MSRMFSGPRKPHDPVNAPSHYTSHPSGVECKTIVEHMSYHVGNAVAYCWRVDLKDDPIENLEKAIYSLQMEVDRLKRMKSPSSVSE